MRVLVVCSDPGIPVHGPAGGSAHLRGVVRGLVANGHAVWVVARTGVDARGRVADPLTVDVAVPAQTATWPRRRTVSSRRLEAWRWTRLVARVARDVVPDVVWERAWVGPGADAGERAARRVGARHLLEVNAPLALERSDARPVSRLLRDERRRLRSADRVIAVSPWLMGWVRRLAPTASVRCVPNGSALVAPAVSREACREALGWTGPVALHHGTLRAWHGLTGASSGIRAVLDAFGTAGWRVVVVGDAPLDAPVLRHPALERLPHADPIALARLLHAADVGLAPYGDDAPPWLDPLKLADCAAVGLSVVGSVHPATRRCAAQVPLGAPQHWVEAAEQIRGDRGAHGRSWSGVCAEALAGWGGASSS
jgi:hypothetical protein